MFKDMLIVFFVIIFLLLVLFLPFKLKILSHLNLIELKGFYSGKIAGIKILEGMIFADINGEIEMKNSANMLSKNFNEEFAKSFGGELVKKLTVLKSEIYIISGFVEDSYLSALLSGTMSAIVKSIYSYFSFEFEESKLICDIKPVFDRSSFEVSVRFVATITIFKIIVSLFKSLKNLKK